MQNVSIRNLKNNINLDYKKPAFFIDINSRRFTVQRIEKNARISTTNTKVSVQNLQRRYTIDSITKAIVITSVGKRGLQGEAGKDGAGVPPGGLPGETLIKTSTEDYDTEWAVIKRTDKYYVQAFNVTDTVVVNHNLLKYPSITVLDSSGDEVEGTIIHNSINTSTVIFSAPFSGIVTCN